jgi:hypothetical protein
MLQRCRLRRPLLALASRLPSHHDLSCGVMVAPARGVMTGRATSQQIKLIRLTEAGEVAQESWTLTEIKRRSRLHARDLVSVLELGSGEGRSQGMLQYRILPRRRCIIFALSHLRGILFSDELCLMLPHSAANDTPKKLHAVIGFALQLQRFLLALKRHGSSNQSHRDAERHAAQLLGVELPQPPSSEPAPSTMSTEEELVINDAGGQTDHAASSGGDSSRGNEASNEAAAPFEFIVLDQLLRMTHARHYKRLAFCRPLVQNALDSLDVEPDRLFTLFPLRNTLEHFQQSSTDIVECLSTVLKNDRDMRECCLSEKRRAFQEAFPGHSTLSSPNGYDGNTVKKVMRGWGNTKSMSVEAGSPTAVLGRVREELLMDLEVMFETHLRNAADIRQQSSQLLRHMDTRQAILDSTLDAYRNHLIDVNLRMTIIGLGVSFGTLLSGLFGEC